MNMSIIGQIKSIVSINGRSRFFFLLASFVITCFYWFCGDFMFGMSIVISKADVKYKPIGNDLNG